MKRKTKSGSLPACLTLALGATLSLPLQAQWLPLTAQYKELTYRTLPDGSEELLHESKGVLFRASSGSEMGTRINAEDGQPTGQAFLKDASTGNLYLINHDLKTARLMKQLPLPLLPSPNMVPSESKSLGRRVINGVECVGKPVLVNGQLVPGASSWFSEALHLDVKTDFTFPSGVRRVVEFFDFQQGEPSASVFSIPEDYTIVDAHPQQ